MQLDARLSVLTVIVCEVAAVSRWKIWKTIGWLQPVGITVGQTDRHVIGQARGVRIDGPPAALRKNAAFFNSVRLTRRPGARHSLPAHDSTAYHSSVTEDPILQVAGKRCHRRRR